MTAHDTSYRFTPADEPTFYFIGVTTGSSSIMRVFPAWAEHLGIDARIVGIDLPLDADRASYRSVVAGIKADPFSLGGLVTTHKLNLYRAASDLFDGVGEETALLGEASSISKRDGALWAHAMDPLTCGLSLEAIVSQRYWSETGGELLLLGAGGSSLALTLYLHRRAVAGLEIPSRVVVTNRRAGRLDEMREIHERLGDRVPIEYHEAPETSDNDRVLAGLASRSVVVNATGLGKDRPGSPLGDTARWPAGAIGWDFNYRGALVFLDQARAAGVAVEDGWTYFLHGWTRVIAEVFHIDIPTAGPSFDQLSRIAKNVSTAAVR